MPRKLYLRALVVIVIEFTIAVALGLALAWLFSVDKDQEWFRFIFWGIFLSLIISYVVIELYYYLRRSKPWESRVQDRVRLGTRVGPTVLQVQRAAIEQERRTTPMNTELTGPQMQLLVKALSKAYTLQRLKQMVTFRLDKDLEEISTANDKYSLIFELVDAANREGWWQKLLVGAKTSNPGNAGLAALEAQLGLSSVPAAAVPTLEKIVSEGSRFRDVAQFRERLGRLEACVCALEIPRSGATGFLVAADLVLTNYHVVEGALNGQLSPKDIRCRLDFKALVNGRVIQPGRAVTLAPDWCVAYRPYSEADKVVTGGVWQPQELDYAVVRLAEPVGDELLGEAGTPSRGWITVKSVPRPVEANDPLFVVQHPQDLKALPECRLQPMQLAIGEALGIVGNGMRIRHNATTLPGSSGSPCCDADLELVALHHAGDPRDWPGYKGEYNQAIPIGLIVADALSQGVEPFWDRAPSVSGGD